MSSTTSVFFRFVMSRKALKTLTFSDSAFFIVEYHNSTFCNGVEFLLNFGAGLYTGHFPSARRGRATQNAEGQKDAEGHGGHRKGLPDEITQKGLSGWNDLP